MANVIATATGSSSSSFSSAVFYPKKHNQEKIQKWKGALMEAANLSGWHSKNYRTEYELVENIVKNIMQKLNRMYSNDLKNLVGIEHNYACVESMLKIGSRNVRIIGIWGMGGLGKTTLAAVAFAKLSSRYEASCFLANVREEATNHGLNYLRNKLLSELLDDKDVYINDIEMHDLIQEMGKEIVRQESSKSPGRRSRLWNPEEIYDIFKSNKVTDTVEGIILNLSQIKSDIHLSHDTLTKMSNLRLVKFFYIWGAKRHNNVHLPKSLDFLPDSIRYLFWEGYPSRSLPSTFRPLNLVQISMQNSKVEKLWDGIQDLAHLNKIDLRNSKHLMELPDFSMASNLEYAFLDGCTSLCQVHSTILSLQKLVTLSLSNCKQLKSPESIIQSRRLEVLRLEGCSSLKEISMMSEDMKIFHLDKTAIAELPSSIGSLNKLEELTIRECFHLKNLPNALRGLTSLQSLDISDCRQVDTEKLAILLNGLRSLTYLNLTNCCNLFQLPENINLVSNLVMLDLSGSNVETLPASIIHLSLLQYIWLFDCRRLQFLPELPPFIEELNVRNCLSLETLLFTNSLSPLTSVSDQVKPSIWLENCVKLDEDSVKAMLKRMKEGTIDRIVYPESKVPNWFRHQTTDAAITIEPQCPSSSNLSCSAVFCLVVSLVSSPDKNIAWDIGCKYNMADGAEVQQTSFDERGYRHTTGLKRTAFGILDHVFVWYNDLPLLDHSKVSFEFFVEPLEKMEEVAISIKGCGVELIYDIKNERVSGSSAANISYDKELEALVIPPIQKSTFPALSTATNWKNQSKGLIDILSL
ncbi:hypothetical protein L6164_025808 [Bauhinia variegata]|uniref:Uncharacterized protein n=1 Tax=Bauhinia variegata TaxID=167791 RepID=A0ACB9M1N4_BAUVA|nr:hypothetical protein L6164_025808 [Bauhinia variegata]